MNTPEYDPNLRPWTMTQQVKTLADHIRKANATCAGENPIWRQFGLAIKAEQPTSNATPVEAKIELLGESLEQLRGDMRLLSRKAQVSPLPYVGTLSQEEKARVLASKRIADAA